MPVPGGVNWAAPWDNGGCLVPGALPASLDPPRPSQAWVSFLMEPGQRCPPAPRLSVSLAWALPCAQGAWRDLSCVGRLGSGESGGLATSGHSGLWMVRGARGGQVARRCERCCPGPPRGRRPFQPRQGRSSKPDTGSATVPQRLSAYRQPQARPPSDLRGQHLPHAACCFQELSLSLGTWGEKGPEHP